MILRLQHQRPDGETDSYYLKPGRRYHIGRGSACEVRILDLKLSRKHCALEHTAGGWHAIDLMSTNGCTLDGDQIVGNVPVHKGSVIEAGQTRLTVADIFPAEGEVVPASRARPPAVHDDGGHDHTETTSPDPDLEQEPLPEGPVDAAARSEAGRGQEWEPEPGSDALTKTDALIPHPDVFAKAPPAPAQPRPRPGSPVERRQPTAVFRAEDLQPDDQDGLATRVRSPVVKPEPAPAPSAPGGAAPGTDVQERTFYITVLGRRVGPLTRAAARELKARELKGALTTADLEQYPLG
jgi:hypothetical protein